MINFEIGGIKKTSLLDFPDKISAIVFTRGCNFNCGFCHNPFLLHGNGQNINIDGFFDFLKKRKGMLDGIVITGGEPTLQLDLIYFIQKIKSMDFLVKLDTNGYKPEVISDLLSNNLLDYIAMDIKAPLNKYSFVTGINVDTKKIQNSIKLIMNSNIDYEFRTTFMPYFHNIDDFTQIGLLIKGAKKYFLQKFEIHSEINNPKLITQKNFSEEEIQKIINILKFYIPNTILR